MMVGIGSHNNLLVPTPIPRMGMHLNFPYLNIEAGLSKVIWFNLVGSGLRFWDTNSMNYFKNMQLHQEIAPVLLHILHRFAGVKVRNPQFHSVIVHHYALQE